MREFLKKHPDHLSARFDLFSRLRRIAEKRTIQALQLETKTIHEFLEQSDRNERRWEQLEILRDKNSVSNFSDKKLESKIDLEIWSSYAQELDVFLEPKTGHIFVNKTDITIRRWKRAAH